MIIEVGYSRSLLIEPSSDELEKLKSRLGYTDKSISYLIFQANRKLDWAIRNGFENKINYFSQEIARLKKEERVCLVQRISDGRYSIPTGLLSRVQSLVPSSTLVDLRQIPSPSAGFPAMKSFPALRPYQVEQLNQCLTHRQGTVESATGTGKTVVIQEVIRKLGKKTLVVVPSISILDQTINRFQIYFGKGKVGQYGDGKKHISDITIACAPSILRSKPSDWDGIDVLIFDEDHHVACNTLERICYEFIPNAYYRFGFTATPYRADGADLAIEGATFPIVHTYSVQQGIADGYLARPVFANIQIDRSPSSMDTDDHVKMFQEHVIHNDYLNTIVVNQAVALLQKNKQLILLVKEKTHGHILWSLLRKKGFDAEFVRTKESPDERVELTDEAGELAPWKDHTKVVEDFNRGITRCVIGTSIIGEGTDIIPVDALFLLCGGASKGIVLQNLGRGLRVTPSKKTVLVFDYVLDKGMLAKHAAKRTEWFGEIGQIKKIDGSAFFV
jgi:superfamily II DNA or RNA helicase